MMRPLSVDSLLNATLSMIFFAIDAGIREQTSDRNPRDRGTEQLLYVQNQARCLCDHYPFWYNSDSTSIFFAHLPSAYLSQRDETDAVQAFWLCLLNANRLHEISSCTA